MLERARQVFLKVTLARESGKPEGIPAADLFPAVAANLEEEIKRRKDQGYSMEFRNLCVRKADLVLIRNFRDNTKDEFTVRISAHAQKIVQKNGEVVSEQEYVTPFEEYWTFGRLDGQWKLKGVQPPAVGQAMVGQENVDEDSSRAQLEWYYQHPRAV